MCFFHVNKFWVGFSKLMKFFVIFESTKVRGEKYFFTNNDVNSREKVTNKLSLIISLKWLSKAKLKPETNFC